MLCVWAWPVGYVARKDFMDRYVLQLAEPCGLEWCCQSFPPQRPLVIPNISWKCGCTLSDETLELSKILHYFRHAWNLTCLIYIGGFSNIYNRFFGVKAIALFHMRCGAMSYGSSWSYSRRDVAQLLMPCSSKHVSSYTQWDCSYLWPWIDLDNIGSMFCIFGSDAL